MPKPPAPERLITPRAPLPRSLQVPVSIIFREKILDIVAFVDSGAPDVYLDATFAARHQIPLTLLPRPEQAVTIDGQPLAAGSILYQTISLTFLLQSQQFTISPRIITCAPHSLVLGYSWLAMVNPTIDWQNGRLSLSSRLSALTSILPTSPSHLSLLSSSSSPLPAVSPPSASSSSADTSVSPSSPSIPPEYLDFSDVFSVEQANVLPPHRPSDMAIDLLPNTSPPYGPIYSLSETELQCLRTYLDDNLAKGFIRSSTSPASAPLLFVKKKDSSLRPCVDYRGLNAITTKNRYPLPLIGELLDRLRGARHFTKLDLRNAYNLIRIRKGDEWKTAFRCRYGHYEYMVMPFGLANAPACFQSVVNDMFRDFLDKFLAAYLDDLLIYTSGSRAEHVACVRSVLLRLRQHHFFVKLEKCVFDAPSVVFLGYQISQDGLKMDPEKVSALSKWTTPRNLREVQSFLGFANFYRRFIPNFAATSHPLTNLTRKGTPFVWNEPQASAFSSLLSAFAAPTVLAHPDFTLPFVLEADSSDYALGSVLSQRSSPGNLRPVAYHSRQLTSAERNYPIYDKELLAILDSFLKWRHYLVGSPQLITVLSDHKNLQYFITTPRLSPRQARWAQLLADYHFVIDFRRGKDHTKADALSRSLPFPGPNPDNARSLLSPEQFTATIGMLQTAETLPSESFLTATREDPLFQLLDRGQPPPSRFGHPLDFIISDGLVYRNSLLYVPESQRPIILHDKHTAHTAGHPGRTKTLAALNRSFWWPGLYSDVVKYIKSCDRCQRVKPARHRPFGLLEPLPSPSGPWESITLDFITHLPPSNNFTAVLTIVDRFTKMAHFVPTYDEVTAEDTAQLFLDNIFRFHGLPVSIVTDRGSQFTSKFWRRLHQLLHVKLNFSSSYHPQTDGQSERVNQVFEQFLRCYVNQQQDNWSSLLPLAEFAYNNSEHEATQKTPFFATFGYHPRADFGDIPLRSQVPAAESSVTTLLAHREEIRDHLDAARARMKHYADRSRQAAPPFAVGDWAYLEATHLKPTRPSAKLADRRLGPFRITHRINEVAFRLQLPQGSRLHNVFHVSLLTPATAPATSSSTPALAADVADPTFYAVSALLDSRRRGRRLEYFVDWADYPASERSWEPFSHLRTMVPNLIQDFHASYPDKPRPVHLPARISALPALF